MRKLTSFFLTGLLITNVIASENKPLFCKETLQSCYEKPMSAAVQNCMIYLSSMKAKEYENEFNSFIKKTDNAKASFHNYKGFVNSIKEAKRNWDLFIKNECIAEALIDEKESLAYYTDYHSCLVNGYQERIKYYKLYQY